MDAFTNLGSAFVSTALDGEDIRVISVTGVERIGQLYEFRVRFRHDAGRLTESEIDDSRSPLAPCGSPTGRIPSTGLRRPWSS